MSPLATLTDPYLGLFRGIIPPLGGTIDLSPILAFVTLDLLTSSAAALPCEMPTTATEEGEEQRGGERERRGWRLGGSPLARGAGGAFRASSLPPRGAAPRSSSSERRERERERDEK